MEKKLNVGLIGFGFSGRVFQAPLITSVEGLHLSKVVERRGQLSKAIYPWVEVVTEISEVLDDPAIDLVVVATPSTNHYEIAKAALMADKHVVVEKPFTTTVVEAEELIELAAQRGKVLSVYHNRRWDGDFLTIRELLQSDMLGELVECQFRWDRYSPIVDTSKWKETSELGAGGLYDLGVHFFDQVLTLFGMPTTIEADLQTQREGGIADDYFAVTLGYGKLKVTVSSSRLIREAGPRYTLFGTNGTYTKHGLDPQENALKAGETPRTLGYGVESKEMWGTIITNRNGIRISGNVETKIGNYARYYQDIFEAIRDGREPAVKATEARNTIKLVELARLSNQEKRRITVE